MPDDESTPPPPRRQRPRMSELAGSTTETDLWNLDEDLPSAKAKRPQPRELPGTPAPPAAAKASPPADEPVEEAAPEAPEVSSPPATVETPAVGPAQPEAPAAEPEEAKPAPAGLGKHEKIGLIAIAVILAGIAVWAVAGLLRNVPTTRYGAGQPDLPAEGTYATVDDATTFWRKPVREGANPDQAHGEAEFIPVVSVTLDGGTSGVIRVIFRNESGEYIGDNISRTFSDGRFDRSGSETIEFPATDGFRDSAGYNSYRVGTDRWTAEVIEGPSRGASGSEFKTLFTIPVSTELH